MRKRFGYVFAILMIFANLAGVDFTKKAIMLNNDNVINFDPVIEYRSSGRSGFERKTMLLQSYSESNGDHIYNYRVNNVVTDLVISPDGSFWKVSVKVRASQNVEIRKFFIKMNNLNHNSLTTFKGPEAIQNENSNYNVTLAPFSNRIVRFLNGSRICYTVLASHFKETEGIEYIDSNEFYLFSPKYHADRIFIVNPVFQTFYYDYKPLNANEDMKAVFYFTEEEINFPLVNLYPSGYKAALSIQNDADCENAERIKVVFRGNSLISSNGPFEKGLFANNIRISNTVFGNDFSQLGSLWNEIKSKGSTIGYHTFQDKADNMDSLYANFDLIKPQYNMRLWVDHSSRDNPEDLAINGFLPHSVQYIYPLLKNNNISYAWIDDYKPMTLDVFNAFDDLSMLPHRTYSLAKDYPLYVFTRFRTVTWIYMNYQFSFKYLISSKNLDNLISKRGYANVYTHFYYGNAPSSNIEGFFVVPGNGELVFRPEADSLFKMLNNYQTNRGLWIAPSEEIFDRFLATDSVKITDIQMVDNKLVVTLCNMSENTIKDFELIINDNSKVIRYLKPRTSYIVRFENNLTPPHYDKPKLIKFNSTILSPFFDGDLIKIKSSEDISSLVHKISLYNIKGKRINEPVRIIDTNISFNRKKIPSGIILCKIELKDNQSRVIKIKNIK